MLYDLSNVIDRDRMNRKRKIAENKGQVVEFTIKEPRSPNQNKYMHVLIDYFATVTGYSKAYVKDEYFKKTASPDLFVVERYDDILRTETIELRSSKSLTVFEMSIAITRFRNWSVQEAEIYLPDAEDRKYIQALEVEISKHKEYL